MVPRMSPHQARSTPSTVDLASTRSGSTSRRGWVTWAGTLALGLSLLSPADARPPTPPTTSGLPVVALSELPVQARKVHALILSGGPFRYDKDGTVFFNRERLLPRQPRGFYREYTVPTPGLRHRGARRIVCGGQVITVPETCFYTEDHYQSFREIDPRR